MKNIKIIMLSWGILLSGIIILFIFVLMRIRPLVIDYSVSSAEGELLTVAERAVSKVINDSITYDKISNVTRDSDNNFKGIELNSKEVSRIKSEISKQIALEVSKDCFIKVGIPVTTLLNIDFFSESGPKIYFTTQFYNSSVIDFENTFVSCGINQVLHQVVLKVKLSGNIISLGKKRGFSTSTSVIVAQTVIVGTVPNDYTEFSSGNIFRK